MDGLPIKPAIVQVDHSLFCIFFTAKLKAKATFPLQYTEATGVDKRFLSNHIVQYLRLMASNETRSYFRFLGQSIKSKISMTAFQ